MNETKLYVEYYFGGEVYPSAKYGGEGRQLADAAALGAVYARQYGDRDLLWSFLVPKTEITSSADLVEGDSLPLSADLPAVVNTEDQLQAVRDLLDQAYENGVQLVATFFTRATGDTSPAPSGETGSGGEGVDYTHAPNIGGTDYDLTDSSLEVDWSEDHVGQVDSYGNYFQLRRRDLAGGYPRWALHALDVSSAYERGYLRDLAGNAIDLLQDSLSYGSTTATYSLDQVLPIIEVFNEVQMKQVYESEAGGYSAATSGEFWGRAYAQIAWGLRSQLTSYGYSATGVRIHLPALVSYHEEAGGVHEWAYSMSFLAAMVQGAVDELVDSRKLGVPLFALGNYIQGIDYHFYHNEPREHRHIAYLGFEVAEIQEEVRTAIFQVIGAMAPRYATLAAVIADSVSSSFMVTCFESGCSATEATAEIQTSKPTTFIPPGYPDPETFQAHEVFRRLVGALAAEADIAGWHSWLAYSESSDPPSDGREQSVSYAGFGLRHVDDREREGSAWAAVPRQSWFAFKRLTDLLLGTSTVTMVLPFPSTRDEIELLSHPFVVFEITVSFFSPWRPWRYLYLLLRDPYAAVEASPVSLADHLSTHVAANCALIPLIPASRGYRLPTDPEDLPIPVATYDPPTLFTTPAVLCLKRNDPPILVCADRALDWSVV